MKATELRLGNLIYDFNADIITVDSIVVGTKSMTIINGYDPDEELCHPIPLTEEWLIKFGFKKYGTLDNCYILGHIIVEIGIMEDTWNCRITMTKTKSLHLRGLEYVHTLQNLYFSFKDEELTIK